MWIMSWSLSPGSPDLENIKKAPSTSLKLAGNNKYIIVKKGEGLKKTIFLKYI